MAAQTLRWRADHQHRSCARWVRRAHTLQALRTHLGTAVPAIIMTGDTSPQRLRDAQSTSALLLHKPVSTDQLREAMVQLITQP